MMVMMVVKVVVVVRVVVGEVMLVLGEDGSNLRYLK